MAEEEARKNRNITTRFCCEALTEIEKRGIPIPDYIKEWWERHKKWDCERKHKGGDKQ